ncbi:synaptobrevin [Coprinellus micaceus]|uniref:Protein transport protein BOS1 n=1 Tax=Coprinellus micaceus TaxID=71717 RepID=A0A4Y7TW55_COPMI|nr:synaptobrevin [Coprinellus micaceus]
MNSLYTTGVRQTNSLQADLERLRNGDNSAALLGQISASLSAMSRTIEDYDAMAKREMIKAKQEKAQMRVSKFRSDYVELRSQFEKYKEEAAAAHATAQRTELISGAAPLASPSDARRRFQTTHPPSQSTLHPALRPQNTETISESPFRASATHSGFSQRQMHALDEHSFIQNTSERLDEFLAQGREVLDNLVDQRQVLKGTHKRLLDTANALGLSRNVIVWIEKRSTQDMYIFIFGGIFTFFCFFLIWYYLG